MKELPFKRAMEELRSARETVPVAPRTVVTRRSEKADGSYVADNVKYRITYQCVFTMSMIVDDNVEAIKHGHAKAVHAMTETMYGPLRGELVELLHMMWETGTDIEVEKKLRDILRIFT